jgi:hypothetical protein
VPDVDPATFQLEVSGMGVKEVRYPRVENLFKPDSVAVMLCYLTYFSVFSTWYLIYFFVLLDF